MTFKWEKLGRLIKPNKDIFWMNGFTGASFAVHTVDNEFDLYLTGRDQFNRSIIGKASLKIEEEVKILNIKKKPILEPGEQGAFDENGVSYPCLVKNDENLYLYYTGWVPCVNIPFQNHVGLAIINKKGEVTRQSRAPVLDRNNDDFLSIGSVNVMKDGDIWRMWYTSFVKWEIIEGQKPKHYYHIKYAESKDGINWNRNNKIVIDFADSTEYAIARPSVLKLNDRYHMFFSVRGEKYRIGYAESEDGINWKRDDSKSGISLSNDGWDSEEQCYPNIFTYKDYFYLLYNGNNYGNDGLGIARMKIN